MKTAIVKPLSKQRSLDMNIFENNRPVSNLSFICNILDEVVLQQLVDYLYHNNLLNASQAAYRLSHVYRLAAQ